MLYLYQGVISCLFLLLSVTLLPAQTRLYVRAGSDCNSNCGQNWGNAYGDLQLALSAARQTSEVKEIWVAQGTYRPADADRSVSFELPNGVAIRGGFSGDGPDPDARDPQQFLTILSGDLQGDDQDDFLSYSDNSYHVIYTNAVDATTILDGFTIRGGNADNAGGMDQDDGGGWYNSQYKDTSSPTVRNCIFTENRALRNGGAIYSGGKFGTISPTFTNCTFTNNQAKTGGVIYNNGNSNVASPVFSRCVFYDNSVLGSGAVGGVIYSFARANSDNGTLYESATLPEFDNCIFARNYSEFNAGTLYFLSDGGGGPARAFPSVQSCTFYANDAAVGGAVYLNASNDGTNVAMIQNCVFWDSRSINDPIFHYSHAGNGAPPVIDITFSLVDTDNCDHLIPDGPGEVSCSNMLFITDTEVPMFVDADRDDFHLATGSPAINAGSNALVHSSTDFEGQVRIQETTVDMGADEVEALTDTRQPVPDGAITLYPNPVREQIQIRWSGASPSGLTYRLLNQIGQEVRTGNLDFSDGNATIANLHGRLSAGVYFLQIADKTFRIIKQ
ncbi:choice-of-anchor Q domain-containing protein [Flavilitoribacter nigricans]|uniref:Secretion system C-terminal sorting domain-containing protein n=1 Tax=Flavilitoribacter nigricans (strain ATCC 23147 / DSM 23189 / NBRC 102662 / NCIMB 1420 / SS-2) TaxID=1122177 RepID=A0A2D0N8P7_FLAN2|nr:choice-of-anchor Q domain-containing protein [Flavilitoribacter nigricans]PHN04766.1 hypothetical protein CRP01_19840 [Flavilitoribacter nigricans DSM 23189 = NBRC 102662]